MPDGESMTRSGSPGGGTATDGLGPSPIARLYGELAPELRRFLQGVLRDPELVDDVMQATFVKAIENGGQARLETSRGWLFQVAFHEALGVRRRQLVRDKGQSKVAALRPRVDSAPDEGLLRGETIDAVREALQRLPAEQRAVVLARIYEDKTFAEIAQQMSLPLGTVLTRMRRGLEKMHSFLRPGD